MKPEILEGRIVEINNVNTVNSKKGKFKYIETVFLFHEKKPEERMRKNMAYRGVIFPDGILDHEIRLTIGTERDPNAIKEIYDISAGRRYSIMNPF